MSLNTSSWDYIYNLRFTKANDLLTIKQSQTAIDTLKTTLANTLGGDSTGKNGFSGAIVVKTNTAGQGYDSLNPALQSSDSSGNSTIKIITNDTSATCTDITTKKVLNIIVDNSKITKDYTDNTIVTITGVIGSGAGATATAKTGVLIIIVTNNGSGYISPPTVTISGGGGSGAEAIAIMNSADTGKVAFIKVTNQGSGYTSKPNVTLTGSATAEASFGGIAIQVTDNGSGYTAAPTISITDSGGGEGAIATGTLGVEIASVSGGSNFNAVPIIDIPAPASPLLGATAFASLAFSNSSKVVESIGTQSKTVYAAVSINACIKKDVLNTITGFNISDNLNYPTILTTDTSTKVLDYCLAVVGDIVDKRHNKSIAEDLKLQFLFDYKDTDEAKRLAESIKKDYFPNETLAAGESTVSKVTQLLKDKEKNKIKNRVKAALQFVDNQIIYNINETPTSTDALKTLDQLGGEIEKNKEGFLESMIGLLTALYPQPRIMDICGIMRDSHADSIQFPLKKIKLSTGAFTLETGGSDALLRINIPIVTGLFYFGKDSKKYSATAGTDTPKFNIPLLLNLNWMRGAFKDTIDASSPNYVDLAIDSMQLEANIATALPGISTRNKQIVRAFIESYIQNTVKNIDPNIQFFDLVKQPYSYHDVFSQLNMAAYESLGLDSNGIPKAVFDKTQNAQKWLFPSRVAYGIKDEITLPADSKNSILAICCMINGNSNNDVAYTDLNAIPAGASSALVIERGVFAEHMVKAAFVNGDKLFKNANEKLEKNGAYSFSNNDKPMVIIKKGTEVEISKSGFNPFFNSNIENDDFKIENGKLTYKKDQFSSLLQLNSKDSKNENGVAVSGTVAPERLLISVEESNIKLSMGDVEYTYNEKGSFIGFNLKDENKPTINQEYVFNLVWDTTNKKIDAKAKEKLFIISNTFGSDTKRDWLVNVGAPIVKNFFINPLLTVWFERESIQKSFIRIEDNKKKSKSKNTRVMPSAIDRNSSGIELQSVNDSYLENRDASQNPLNFSLSYEERQNARRLSGDRPRIIQNQGNFATIENSNYLNVLKEKVEALLEGCKAINNKISNLNGLNVNKKSDRREDIDLMAFYIEFLESIKDELRIFNRYDNFFDNYELLFKTDLDNNDIASGDATSNRWLFKKENWLKKFGQVYGLGDDYKRYENKFNNKVEVRKTMPYVISSPVVNKDDDKNFIKKHPEFKKIKNIVCLEKIIFALNRLKEFNENKEYYFTWEGPHHSTLL